MKILLDEIIAKLHGIKYEIRGKKIGEFFGFGPLDGESYGLISFCKYRGSESEKPLLETKASLIFCRPDAVLPDDNSKTYILVDNPRFCFAKILKDFFPEDVDFGISDNANVGKNCQLGKIILGSNVAIGDDVVIGDGTVISANVVIANKVKIGHRVLIKPNSVIGQKGFGFEFDEDAIPFAIPHIGSVKIGDNVEIGSNCTIARGTLGNTEISNFVKIDDHVHVGHNVKIGPKTMIAACAEISGSVKIGADCWLGPNCSMMNQIRIGNNVLIGLGAVVTKSLPDNAVVAGNPAQIIRIKNKEESPWKGISR